MTTKFWGKGSCEIAYPFQVLLPLTGLDTEFEYHNIIRDAQKGGKSLPEVDDILDSIYEHPHIDLAALFNRKRASYSTPSHGEANMLQTCIEECTQEISTLHGRISGLITQIARLCNNLNEEMIRFAQNSGQRAICQYILSPLPMQYINHDVLERIFLECWYSRESDYPDPKEAPLQLAAVSYRWRDIAHSIPQLWGNISVGSSSGKIGSSLTLATKWLRRARSNSDVSMVLDIPSGTSADYPPLVDFLAAFSSSSIQVKRLAFDLEPELDPQEVMNLIWKDRCTGLEELQIGHHTQPDDISIRSIKRLYLLHIPDSWLFAPPSHTNLSILRLTVEIHWDVFESILVHCTNLEKILASVSPHGAPLSYTAGLNFNLSLENSNSTRPTPQPSKITLPRLVYLGIANDDDSSTDIHIPFNFLSNFVFPSLRIFEYYAGQVVASTSLPWLTALSFLGQLQRATLQLPYELAWLTFGELFRLLTSIEELSVDVPEYDDSVLSFLKEFPSNPQILPRLERLHVGISKSIDGIDYEELVQPWLPNLSFTEGGAVFSYPMRPLSHLTFHHWHKADDEKQEDAEEDTEFMVITLESINRLIVDRYPNPPSLHDLNEETRGADLLPTKRLEVQFVRHTLTDWIYNIPMLFEMSPLSFDEVRKFEVLEVDETSETKWVAKTGPIYKVE